MARETGSTEVEQLWVLGSGFDALRREQKSLQSKHRNKTGRRYTGPQKQLREHRGGRVGERGVKRDLVRGWTEGHRKQSCEDMSVRLGKFEFW